MLEKKSSYFARRLFTHVMAKGHKHDCVGEYMHRWKRGQLRSGTGKSGKVGPVVKSQQQAIAIGMSVCNNTEGTSDFGSGCGCGCGGSGSCQAKTMPKDVLKRRQSMLALGYSEEAVDRVLSFCEGKTTGMVKSRLSVIIGRATELLDVIESVEADGAGVEMEPWMIDKLTMAADYLSAAADNARYGDGVDAVYEEVQS